MEDKEIIIDGVNVAGCNFRLEREGKQKCECCHATGFSVICDCDKWHICYYKQLKRLEQENECLKEKLIIAQNSDNKTIEILKENAELKEENERLKKDFSSYEDDIEDWVSDNSILYQYDDRTPDTLEELQACMESTHEQWQNYKQALEEISGILDKSCNQCKNEYLSEDYCSGQGDCFEIRQVINEVLND